MVTEDQKRAMQLHLLSSVMTFLFSPQLDLIRRQMGWRGKRPVCPWEHALQLDCAPEAKQLKKERKIAQMLQKTAVTFMAEKQVVIHLSFTSMCCTSAM